MLLFFIALYGLVIATFGRWLAPTSGPGGWRLSLLLGVAGALLGALIGQWLGMSKGSLAMSLLCAGSFVAFHHSLPNARSATA